MKRARLVISLLLVVAMQTAAKSDPQPANATAHVISLVLVENGIAERREQKEFDTIETCHAWKYQRDFLPPQPGSLVSFVYCELTEVAANGTAKAERALSPPLRGR